MEQFVVRAYDGKGMLEKRLEVRPRQMISESIINNNIKKQ